MNYLSILMVVSGLFLSTNADKPSKINFENLKNVDREFVDFLSAFEKIHLPYEMNLDQVEELLQEEPKYLRHQNEMLNKFILDQNGSRLTKFSRMGPPIIKPLKRFYPTSNTVAVSYVKQNRFGIATGSIMIAVYNLKGKLLSFKEKLVGERYRNGVDLNHAVSTTDYDHTESFKITEDGLLHKTTFKRVWEKDYKEFGTDNNKVVDNELVSQEIFQFRSDGSMASIHRSDQGALAVNGRAE